MTVMPTPLVTPAVAVDFERSVTTGGWATVSALPAEVTPSAVTTVIVAGPAVVRLLDGMVAVQEVRDEQVLSDPTICEAWPPLNAQ